MVGVFKRRIPVPKDVRAEVFKRDNYTCLSYGKVDNLTIDHIKPVAKGGTNDINNLQTLCEKCNLIKGCRRIDYRNVKIGLKVITKIPYKELLPRLSSTEQTKYYKKQNIELESQNKQISKELNIIKGELGELKYRLSKVPKFIRWLLKIKL